LNNKEDESKWGMFNRFCPWMPCAEPPPKQPEMDKTLLNPMTKEQQEKSLFGKKSTLEAIESGKKEEAGGGASTLPNSPSQAPDFSSSSSQTPGGSEKKPTMMTNPSFRRPKSVLTSKSPAEEVLPINSAIVVGGVGLEPPPPPPSSAPPPLTLTAQELHVGGVGLSTNSNSGGGSAYVGGPDGPETDRLMSVHATTSVTAATALSFPTTTTTTITSEVKVALPPTVTEGGAPTGASLFVSNPMASAAVAAEGSAGGGLVVSNPMVAAADSEKTLRSVALPDALNPPTHPQHATPVESGTMAETRTVVSVAAAATTATVVAAEPSPSAASSLPPQISHPPIPLSSSPAPLASAPHYATSQAHETYAEPAVSVVVVANGSNMPGILGGELVTGGTPAPSSASPTGEARLGDSSA